ncbi:hypothetical protein BKA65DRAFT_205990 [Rhexocercosporidium sp. MPI-PUGE-AT-0058]|nr:hypothetical protein BKA65DRAFT_205990 [Rhexocercosporidium sp. MPI-PUGE-AT-0058]
MAPCKSCHTDPDAVEDTSVVRTDLRFIPRSMLSTWFYIPNSLNLLPRFTALPSGNLSYVRTSLTASPNQLVFHAHSPNHLQSACRFTWASHPHAAEISEVILRWIHRHDLEVFNTKGSKINWKGEVKSFSQAFTTLVDGGEFAKLLRDLHEAGFGIATFLNTDQPHEGKTLEEIVKEKIKSRIQRVIESLKGVGFDTGIEGAGLMKTEDPVKPTVDVNDQHEAIEGLDSFLTCNPGSMPQPSLDTERPLVPYQGAQESTKVPIPIDLDSKSGGQNISPDIRILSGPSPLSAVPKQEKEAISAATKPRSKPQQHTSAVAGPSNFQSSTGKRPEVTTASMIVPVSKIRVPTSPPVSAPPISVTFPSIPQVSDSVSKLEEEYADLLRQESKLEEECTDPLRHDEALDVTASERKASISPLVSVPPASVAFPATPQIPQIFESVSKLEDEYADLLRQEEALVLSEQRAAQRKLADTADGMGLLDSSSRLAGQPVPAVKSSTADNQSKVKEELASSELASRPNPQPKASNTFPHPLETSLQVSESLAALSPDSKESAVPTSSISMDIGAKGPEPEPEARIGQYPTLPVEPDSSTASSPELRIGQYPTLPLRPEPIPARRPATPPFILPSCETPLSDLADIDRRIDEHFEIIENYLRARKR